MCVVGDGNQWGAGDGGCQTGNSVQLSHGRSAGEKGEGKDRVGRKIMFYSDNGGEGNGIWTVGKAHFADHP